MLLMSLAVSVHVVATMVQASGVKKLENGCVSDGPCTTALLLQVLYGSSFGDTFIDRYILRL